jgi:hypothetical protein
MGKRSEQHKKLEKENIRFTMEKILYEAHKLQPPDQGLTRLQSLEKIAGLESPKPGDPFSSDLWRKIKAIAIAAPKYAVDLPEIRTNTKNRFLGILKNSPEHYNAVSALPTTQGSLRKNKEPPLKQPFKMKDEGDKISAFYKGYHWRKLRYEVLKKWGRKCMLCGQTEGIMHGDHIKPLRKYWHLRLEFENIQILCEVCNHGKGNWDETDWRPKLEPELKPETRPARTGLSLKRVCLTKPF